MSLDIKDAKVDQLLSEIERVRRRKIMNFNSVGDVHYLDPFNNLDKIKIPNNHIILGRRGSGKTTLLLSTMKKAESDLIVPIDSQLYREWNSSKIILMLLKKICESLETEINTNDDFHEKELDYKNTCTGNINRLKNMVSRVVGKDPYEQHKEYFSYRTYLDYISELKLFLDEIKKLPDEPITIRVKEIKNVSQLQSSKSNIRGRGATHIQGGLGSALTRLKVSLNALVEVNREYQSSGVSKQSSEEEATFEKKFSKNEKVEELIELFSELFSETHNVLGKKIVLYLDDFYLIGAADQPIVIHFFHDIYKNSFNDSFCFKLCSIPNRTHLNKGNKVDFSFKDDFSSIRLDKELYDFENLKDFLLRITANLSPDIGVLPADVFHLFNNEEVLNFTIVATGGVPRDFLVTFAEVLKIARSDDSSTIKKEHLYNAVSDLRLDKEQNIEVEADISPEFLRKSLEFLDSEVIEKLQTNVILYPESLVKKHEVLLKNLVNLRYLHVINENISSEKVKKESFVAYLVDMTFYATGKRLKQGFNFRQFWVQDSGHRHIYLRSAPIWNFSDEFVESLES